jgi:signal transduction histidine kinase/CheY-like chemotaxis protein/HPt (histidine-containing phosphotransfer) domain-containing protein
VQANEQGSKRGSTIAGVSTMSAPAAPRGGALALLGCLVLAGSLVAAAVLFPDARAWLAGALVVGIALCAAGLRGLMRPSLISSVDAPPRASEMPERTESAQAAQVTELRRELDRYKEIEKQLTRAKGEADAAAMAKGEFLATMSHEIRTPLNGIIPLLDIVLSTKLADDQRDYLATAYQSAKQLLSIVDDILDYSKIEANKLELETVGLNIKEIVDSVTRLMAKNAEAKNLKFSATIDANVRLAMRGDPVRLRQVLTNLVSNAIKFTERGSVAIEVKKRSENRTSAELVFTVRDTGIGVAPDQQPKLFKPFSQADASTTRIHGGTGLGLVICKRIVDLMGGQIGVKSEAQRGSSFWFSLSLLKAVGDMVPTRTELHGSRAMIVTTDQAMLRRVSGFFSTWGINYVQTAVSAEALAKLRNAALMGDTWAYDFVILDWGVMRNTALSLARNILRENNLERVRIVAISGEEEVPAELRGATRFAVFGRQFGDTELRAGMQRLLEADAQGDAAASVESLVAEPPAAPAPGTAASPGAPGAPATRVGAPGARPAGLAPVAPAADGALAGHVLLVEDNAVNRQVAQRLLSLVGVSCEVAENGQDAVERLLKGKFDAVLMDCQMPVMDGYNATRTIRRLEAEGARAGHIAVVAMTANAMAGDREKCLAAGMDDYMSKPLNRALLEQMLRRWLPTGSKTQGTPVAAVAPATRTAAAATARPGGVAPNAAGRAPAAYAEVDRAQAAVNAEVIQDLVEMMGSEFTDLVRVYLEDTPRSIAQLEKAAQTNSLEGLIAPSHSLKSTSANLGAISLSEMAKRIEHGARSGHLPGEAVLLVAELGAEFRRAAAELKRIVAGI